VALTYELIGSTTLGSDTQTIVVSSIPSTYTNLVLTIHASYTSSANVAFFYFNGDTNVNNYFFQEIGNTGNSSTSANYRGSNAGWGWWRQGTATDWSNAIHMEIPQYKNTGVVREAYIRAGNSIGNENLIGRWSSTSAITSVTFSAAGGVNTRAGSQLNVWGIKGA
jgi:hypothetical protein